MGTSMISYTAVTSTHKRATGWGLDQFVPGYFFGVRVFGKQAVARAPRASRDLPYSPSPNLGSKPARPQHLHPRPAALKSGGRVKPNCLSGRSHHIPTPYCQLVRKKKTRRMCRIFHSIHARSTACKLLLARLP